MSSNYVLRVAARYCHSFNKVWLKRQDVWLDKISCGQKLLAYLHHWELKIVQSIDQSELFLYILDLDR